MRLLTKVKMLGTLAVAAVVVAAGAQFFERSPGNGQQRSNEARQVTFHVTLGGAARTAQVVTQMPHLPSVHHVAQGAKWQDGPHKIFRWEIARMTVTQSGSGHTACQITADNGQIGEPQSVGGPGTIACQLVVTN